MDQAGECFFGKSGIQQKTLIVVDHVLESGGSRRPIRGSCDVLKRSPHPWDVVDFGEKDAEENFGSSFLNKGRRSRT